MIEANKYIGLVKWFHDQKRNANFGFIQHSEFGDLFFHEHSIEIGQDINSFKANTVVVFTAQESKRHDNKLEAVGVKRLDTERDISFLLQNLLNLLTEKGKYSDYNIFQKEVYLRITYLLGISRDSVILKQLFELFKKYVEEHLPIESVVNIEYLLIVT